MALNIQTFKTRTLTAIVFAVVMLAGLIINNWTFFLLFSFIHFGCWYEYQKLVGLIDSDYRQITFFHKYGVMLAGYGFMLWMLNNEYSIAGFKLHELGWWLLIISIIVLPVAEILLSKKMELKLMAHSFFGLLYISLSWGLLMKLWQTDCFQIFRQNKTGSIVLGNFSGQAILPIIIIACMWVNDTMAYIVGSLIGKTPFSKISPKKTWEGTLGGIVLCVITVGWVSNFYLEHQIAKNALSSQLEINHIHLYIIAAIAAITGTAGDLLESKLKRLANVKDSGNIMPGHGGFLDRFDSLLLATTFVWLYVKLFL